MKNAIPWLVLSLYSLKYMYISDHPNMYNKYIPKEWQSSFVSYIDIFDIYIFRLNE